MKPLVEYAKALWRCVVLFMAGVALQLIFGEIHAGGNVWVCLALLLAFPFLLYLLKERWKFARSISGAESRIVTVCVLVILLLFFGLIPQNGSGRGILGALGFHDMKTSWVFALLLIYFTVLIGIQAITDLKIKKLSAMPIFHWSIFAILVAGICGVGARKTAYIQINEGETLNTAIDAEGNSLQLPFSIKLEDFQMEEYDGTHQPKEFLSKIQITSGKGSKQASVRVNHPARFASWKIYQSGYDVSKGKDSEYSVLNVVRDPMWPVTQIGLWGLLIGCIFMFIDKAARKEAKA